MCIQVSTFLIHFTIPFRFSGAPLAVQSITEEPRGHLILVVKEGVDAGPGGGVPDLHTLV